MAKELVWKLNGCYRTCKAALRKQLDSPQPFEKPVTEEQEGAAGDLIGGDLEIEYLLLREVVIKVL